MIVKDEEAVLGRCLESVKGLFEETVVVDTGSRDRTREIARAHSCLVYDFPWRDDFALARNFAFSKGTGDYLLWLDADDLFPPESAQKMGELRALLERERPDAVCCPYETGDAALVFYRERFLRREAGSKWRGRVHECIEVRGKSIRFPLKIVHLGSEKPRGMRNLHLYQAWAGEEKLSPRDLFYYGRELYYHKLYTEAIAVLEEMLDGGGWYVNEIEACKVLAACRTARGEREAALAALLRTFRYGEPRAAVCCEIGNMLRDKGDLRSAVFWYESALRCRDHAEEGDFETPAARTVDPLLALVYCCYRLGDRERSLYYHKKTEELAPEHPSVLYNRSFFGE